MLVRHAVLLTEHAAKHAHPACPGLAGERASRAEGSLLAASLPSPARLTKLPSCRQTAPLTPLAATLMEFPASVANKRLTAGLSPLAATLTKNIGGGGHILQAKSGYLASPCVRAHSLIPVPIPYPLPVPSKAEGSPFLSLLYTLPCATALPQLLWNQFVAHSFHRDGGCTPLLPYSFSPRLPLAARRRKMPAGMPALRRRRRAAGLRRPPLQKTRAREVWWRGRGWIFRRAELAGGRVRRFRGVRVGRGGWRAGRRAGR